MSQFRRSVDERRHNIDPQEPNISCPHFDDAIEQIEKARSTNETLREWGNAWKKFALEKVAEIENHGKQIKDLEDVIQDMKLEIINWEARLNGE